MPFRSPASELRFHLALAGFDRVAATDRFAEATPETVEAVLEGAARLCDDALAPLNRAGDREGARLENGVVRTPAGFADGYREIASGGWIGVAADPDWGGQGLPLALATCVNDMMSGACLSLSLNPLMTQGAIEALSAHASPELQAMALPRLVSGEWCGTMNLTEPQAGSDVGALATRAEGAGDGTYRITGQKIFITWADNDFSANVAHLVLARLPDAGPGTRGISLFLVPKILPDGQRNALRVMSLEEKLGLHGSPTAVMAYEGATGWLVGAPHAGMAAMFTMMNNARLGVGVQGVGVAEAATQGATAYALERRQGGRAIADYPDVRRMLAEMRAETFAARSIAMACAVALDMAQATGDPAWRARAALLTPIAKAFGTDTGHAVAQTGIQVHGGMGFIEETGAAQFARDVRVTQIYEGTNGIQALDLVGRKLNDGGAAALALLGEIEGPEARALEEATQVLAARPLPDRAPGATAYLRAFARVLGADAHRRAAGIDPARAPLARFHEARLLPEAGPLVAQALSQELPTAEELAA